jgi:hypothetical protein
VNGIRDLIAELPSTLLDVIDGIFSAAVAEALPSVTPMPVAQPMPVVQPDPIHRRRDPRLISADHVRLVLERYGWRDVELYRRAAEPIADLRAVLSCGHRQLYTLNERDIAACREHDAEIALLDRVVDGTERSCQCMVPA